MIYERPLLFLINNNNCIDIQNNHNFKLYLSYIT